MQDLYELKIDQASWTTYCGTNNPEGDGCVETAPAGEGVVLLRDSKRPGAGELRFTHDEIAEFVTGYAREHNITL
ncbi:DUF397 domain-containing protein [Amycolatopsis sp. NPDC003861]